MKKNSIIVLISSLLCAVLIGVMAVVVLLITMPEKVKMEDYTVVVSDEITLYEGDEYTLMPYLVYKDGSVATSFFEYDCSGSSVKVTENGVLSVAGVPQGEVTVRVTDKNTSAYAVIKVNVVSKLTNVLGITFKEGETETLVKGEQTLGLGQSYAIKVVTQPHNIEIKDYCSVKTVDASGAEKDVMSVTYSGNNLQVTTVGLGRGTIKISVKNDDNAEIYSSDIDFSIETPDDAEVGKQILKSENKTLLSKAELDKIERVTLDDKVTSLAPLSDLPALNTVVFSSDGVMNVDGVSEKYCYRVKKDVFLNYETDEEWSERFTKVIPYGESADELYVVYHNSRAQEESDRVVFEEYDANLVQLRQLTDTGYIHDWWIDENDKIFFINDPEKLTAIKLNGIHLFSEWQPIHYTIKYNVTGTTDKDEETWAYDQFGQLALCSEISNKKITGYKFAGWSQIEGNNEFDLDEDNLYLVGEEYGNFTAEDKAEINLYDKWVPIVYTIKYDNNGISGEQLPDKQLKYSELYAVPAGVARGYTFINWKLGNGDDQQVFEANQQISKLSEIDGDILNFIAEWTENSYIMHFDLSGGNVKGNKSETTYPSLVREYTKPVDLPKLEKDGYSGYFWYVDLNNDSVCNDGEPTYDDNVETLIRVVGEGEVYIRAVWSQGTYRVIYNLAVSSGASLDDNAKTEVEYSFEEEFNIPGASRKGYILNYWNLNGKRYTAGQKVSKLVTGGRITFTAVWKPITYKLNINANGGSYSGFNVSNSISYDTTFKLPSATRAGHDFASWYINGANYSAGATVSNLTDIDGATVDVKAVWNVRYHKITSDLTNANLWLNDTQATGMSRVAYGTSIKVKIKYTKEENRTCYIKFDNNEYYKGKTEVTFTMPDSDVLIYAYSKGCFTEGTLITMADGSQRKIEELKVGDMIMSWNFITGKAEAMPISMFWYHGTETYEVLNLSFSDNRQVRVLMAHGFFDLDLNKFVFIDKYSYTKYIGHRFADYQADGSYSETILTGVEITVEEVGCYSLRAACNDNAIAEGLISLTMEDYDGFLTYFEVGENLKYDEEKMQADIDKYGLFKYEDWADLVTYEEFVALNGQYFSILLGKGIITYDDIFTLVEGMR